MHHAQNRRISLFVGSIVFATLFVACGASNDSTGGGGAGGSAGTTGGAGTTGNAGTTGGRSFFWSALWPKCRTVSSTGPGAPAAM